MTYPRIPIHQPTFAAITAGGLIALAAGAILGLLQPLEFAQAATAQAVDVSSTGSLAVSQPAQRVWVDPKPAVSRASY